MVSTFKDKKWSDAALRKVEAACVEFQSDVDNTIYWRTPIAVLAIVGEEEDQQLTVRWAAECGMDELELEITPDDLSVWDGLKGKPAEDRYNRLTRVLVKEHNEKHKRHDQKAAAERQKRTALTPRTNNGVNDIARAAR